MSYLWLFIGIHLMSIFEGITEAQTWNLRDGTGSVDSARYHSERLFEMSGAILLGWRLMLMPALSRADSLLMMISLIFIYYLPYQMFFERFRVPIEMVKKDWDVELFPGIVIHIPHPPLWMQVLIYVTGLVLLYGVL